MSSTAEKNTSSAIIEPQDRLAQALEPYITEWANTLTEGETELITRLHSSEAAGMFAIWLSDKVMLYSMLWKGEWQKRMVVEANAREVVEDLKQVERDLKKAERELQELRFALERAARKERDLRRENGFLKRVVGSMKWEQTSGSDTDVDVVGLGLMME